ncbi:MAG TPA: N-acetylmuramoyl-L-alanine amidase-like domain-containing protein [Gemmatimonadales bacterium]|nr:N-acetylmuramoyl-L-alanine amidase-like domain-containing protein [Gemmatimonadales bacterium]
MSDMLSRRTLLRRAAAAGAALAIPAPLAACMRERPGLAADPDGTRLHDWTRALRSEGLVVRKTPLGRSAIRVGELARGSPYEPYTLDTYLRSGGDPGSEPLTLSLTQFDCVTLVEACLGVARVAQSNEAPTWQRLGSEVERMRYRDGKREGYTSRLHYFSEWIQDGARRGLVRDLGEELGGVEDQRPLRFMTAHRDKYPALRNVAVFQEIEEIEHRLDHEIRRVIPTKVIPQLVDRIETGDVLAFATEIAGLDVTHAAFAYRSGDGVLRVLHAPLSGGVVEVTRATLPEYVAAIKRSTGVLVARPLRG